MPDRIALNLASLGPAPLETKLYAASAAGFSTVGLILDEMEAAGERGAREITLCDLSVAELAALSGWVAPDHTSRMLAMAHAEATFELAAKLGSFVVIAWPPAGPADPIVVGRAFADICRLAEPSGIPVALEFLGDSESICDLASAWEIVQLAEAPNGGLAIDTFHFHRGRSTLQMLEPVAGDKIFFVQVSDAVDLPPSELQDRHRVYPGSGAIPLDPLLAAIHDKGYSGY
ncbi:MAG: sugar phosphate isomerase/epimerase, partial [Armatimonadota bacterium]